MTAARCGRGEEKHGRQPLFADPRAKGDHRRGRIYVAYSLVMNAVQEKSVIALTLLSELKRGGRSVATKV